MGGRELGLQRFLTCVQGLLKTVGPSVLLSVSWIQLRLVSFLRFLLGVFFACFPKCSKIAGACLAIFLNSVWKPLDDLCSFGPCFGVS